MKQVWKYQLKQAEPHAMAMKKGAQIVSVQKQQGLVCIWAIVDVDAEEEQRAFFVAGTGHPLPNEDAHHKNHHIDTIQDGAFVWHVFELRCSPAGFQ